MTDITAMIVSIGSLALLWIFLFWLYPDYRIDSFRQSVFRLRDEFFDEAANGNIPFGKGYGLLRSTMNGYIRFAHEINIIHLIIGTFTYPRRSRETDFRNMFMNATSDLDSNELKLILSYKNRLNSIVLTHILKSQSIVMLTVAIPSAFLLLIPIVFLAAISIIFMSVALHYFINSIADVFKYQHCLNSIANIFRFQLEEISALAYAAGDDSGRRGEAC